MLGGDDLVGVDVVRDDEALAMEGFGGGRSHGKGEERAGRGERGRRSCENFVGDEGRGSGGPLQRNRRGGGRKVGSLKGGVGGNLEAGRGSYSRHSYSFKLLSQLLTEIL